MFNCLKTFYRDFKEIQNASQNFVFELISPFLSTLTLNDLQVELKDFRSKWKNLNKSIQTHYSELTNEIKDNSDSSDEYQYEKCELINNIMLLINVKLSVTPFFKNVSLEKEFWCP
ncbi:hypothetical protein QTP88_009139 [Uroleucon formosanum]